MEDSTLRVGVALHSLRAVPQDAMRAVLDSGWSTGADPHSYRRADRRRCRTASRCATRGRSKWLLDHAPVDPRWCLVHATHMTADENAPRRRSGAVAGICPTTEANLGDGLFPLKAYLDAGGTLGIGSDSHISVSPIEELRWLEYGQGSARGIAISPCPSRATASVKRCGATRCMVARRLRACRLEKSMAAIPITGNESACRLSRPRSGFASPGRPHCGKCSRHVPVRRQFESRASRHGQRQVVVRDFRHTDEERIAERYRETAKRLSDSL
jgi:formimidoylglutamate deiminase